MKKHIVLLIFSFFTLSVFAQKNVSEYIELMKSSVIQSYAIDLNNDNRLDSIYLKFPASSKHPQFSYSDPGQFNILEIKLSGEESYVIGDSFDFLPKELLERTDNQINSKFIYISNTNKVSYLFLGGAEFGCCLEKLFIIKVDKSGVLEVLNSSFDLYEFDKIKDANQYSLIGLKNLSEGWGGYKTQFNFESLTYPKAYNLNDSLIYDKKRTIKYNQDLIAEYGNFLNFANPVFVNDELTNKRILIDFNEDERLSYQLEYDEMSRSRLKKSYFDKFDKRELRLMRNEVFASYGYIFSSLDLKSYFENKKWYKPKSKNVDKELTEIEKYNLELLLEVERRNAP